MPDGSWHQQEWADAKGFKHSLVAAGALEDGRVRLACMKPLRSGGIGHICLVHNGRTIESRSKTGPDRRAWTGLGWQSRCRVWVLS